VTMLGSDHRGTRSVVSTTPVVDRDAALTPLPLQRYQTIP